MSISPRIHRYEQIAGDIRSAVLRGAYDPDGRLPSERRLVRAYGVQRNTVRQALGVLEDEGRIESVGKSGWYVAQGPPRSGSVATEGGRILLVTFRRHASASTDTIAHELSRICTSSGMQVLRYDSVAKEPSTHAATAEDLASLGPAGVVLWPHGPVDAGLLIRVQAMTPVVLIDRRVFGFASDSVLFDNVGGGRLVTEHLIAQGHRRIAFLGDEPFVESVQGRWHGYRQALEAADIVPDDNLTVLTQGQHEPTLAATLRVLVRSLSHPPTAVVCSNDSVASRLMLFLRSEGLKVPNDVAVTGFGNERPNYLDLMHLTTVAQSFVELGRAAGELLMERLADPSAFHGVHRELLLPMRLVVRSSSGPNIASALPTAPEEGVAKP